MFVIGNHVGIKAIFSHFSTARYAILRPLLVPPTSPERYETSDPQRQNALNHRFQGVPCPHEDEKNAKPGIWNLSAT
jgi:hypothetical protein